MVNTLLLPTIAAVIYSLAKAFEIFYIEKEKIVPVKDIVKDGIIVLVVTLISNIFLSGFSGQLNQFMNVITDNKGVLPESVSVFTDTPGF